MTMFDRNPDRPPVDALIALAQQGIFTMPKAVLDAVRREQRIRTWATEIAATERANTETLTAEIANDLLTLAATSETMPVNFGKRITAARDEERRLDALANALRIAALQVETDLIGGVRAQADAIHKKLVAVHEATLDEAGKVAPALTGFDLSNRALFLDVKDPVRRDYLHLERLSESYQSVVAARRYLRRLTGGPKLDHEGLFGQFQNPMDVWGSRFSGRHLSKSTPWPRHPVAFLAWLVTSVAESWLPTVPQQDTAYQAMAEATRSLRPAVASH